MISGERNTILVAGYYGFQNLGDEMILGGMVSSLLRIEPDLNIVVVSGDPKDTRRRHGLEAVLWTDLEAIAQAVSHSRLVILGGGGLFHDRHDFHLDLSHLLTSNHAGLTFYTDICLMAHLSGVPYVLAGVGVGPLSSQTARDLTTWCFQNAAAATVRDSYSLDKLMELGALTDEDLQSVRVAADLGWLNPLLGQAKGKPKSDLGLNRLAVIPRSWSVPDADWEDGLAEALARVEVDEIVFLPFQVLKDGDTVDDEAVCRRLMDHPVLSEKSMRIEEPPQTIEGAIGVLESCTAVIGMRYHGVLAALMAGKPVLAMAYDPKVSSLMGEAGLDDWVLTPADWKSNTLYQRFKSLMEDRPILSSERLEEQCLRAHITPQRIEAAWSAKPGLETTSEIILQSLLATKTDLENIKDSYQQNQRLLADMTFQLREHKRQGVELSNQLHQIQTSRYWRVLGWYWKLRGAAGSLWRRARRVGRRIGRPFTGRSAVRPPGWEDWGLLPARSGKVDILVLPIIDWDFRFQRPQQLARRLAAAGHRVFYLKTTFSSRDLSFQELEAGVYQIQLPGSSGASIYRDLPSDLELALQLRAMDQMAHAADVAEAVCLVQFPYWGPLAAELRRRNGWKVVYDCLDDHGGFSTNAQEMLELEKDLLVESDLVLATSEQLFHQANQIHTNAQLLPNAADLAHFTPASARHPAPPDFPNVNGPMIGYIGAVSEWFDFDLLRHAAENLPDCFFYLIGDTWGSDEHTDLSARPNVIFAGEKSYTSLPAYLAQFDVCMIPFKDLRLTQATDPVKVYEYLAAGKTVVARDLPELRKFAPLIHLIDSPQTFTQAIRQALEETGAEESERRQHAVAGHDWSERVGRLTAWLEDLFQPVSLVIPVWDQLEQTRTSLTSLLETTRHPKLELIVVDNASDDPTAAYLTQLVQSDERFKVIRLEENTGFAPAVNAGLRAAEGDILGILNNDVILTRGWLSRLMGHLDRDPSIGMIGPVTNSVGNEAQVPFDYTDRRRLEEFASGMAHHYAGRNAPIPMLAMYCALMPRAVYQQVGDLDERFGVGMFEDDDYAIRLRQAGYRPACARDVFIHHEGQASFEKLGTQRYRTIFSSNQKAFESKWGIQWDGHSDRGLDEYEQAAYKLKDMLLADTKPCIIVPMHRRRAEKEQSTWLDSIRQSDELLAFWGEDGKVEFELGSQNLDGIPWVASDLIASSKIAPLDPVKVKEIKLRVRSPGVFEDHQERI